MDAKYKFEFTVMASGLFMLLTVYEMPVATYFKVFPRRCRSTADAFDFANTNTYLLG
ncbi:uncharacterized protein LOC112691759 isoform X3 [Sipha flava]|uniref:Uncharacterized protein LOC112691759 isoform X3 n=1 Tax=Sipha flava TaxID=143950 RepID=A0A8B8GH66_9HEMI|nr:uncharacterized protein LOC112691759 isoform X3 [Sipha flava]